MKTDKLTKKNAAITVGIVGHTNHGKSKLIKCLSGCEATGHAVGKSHCEFSPATLIAPVLMSDGLTAALVEIPAYDREPSCSIRWLFAVDMVILVVAADDGVMPQTKAMLDLMAQFDIRHGIIALTKTDLVDAELRRMAEEEIRDAVGDTFLMNTPILPVSPVGGEGVHELMTCFSEVASRIPPKPSQLPFRMWIDRVMSIPGVGTVACGTVLSGNISVDDPLVLLPDNRTTKARSLEVHHCRVNQAAAGQRVGINLPKIVPDNLTRGKSLGAPGAWKTGRYINAALRVASPVVDGHQVSIYFGTAATEAVIILMQTKILSPGESGLVQLHLPHEFAVARQDRFVITLSNHYDVIGGGTALEVAENKFDEHNADETVAFLEALQTGRADTLIRACLRRYADRTMDMTEMSEVTGLPESGIQQEIPGMIERAEVIRLSSGVFYLREYFDQCAENIINVMKSRLTLHPLSPFVKKEEIKAFLKNPLCDTLFDSVMETLVENRRIQQQGADYLIPGFQCILTDDQQRLVRQIINYAEQNGDSPFSIGSFFHNTRIRTNKKEVILIVDYLCRQGELVRICFDHYLLPASLDSIKLRVIKAAEATDYIHLAASKEILGFGRSKGTLVFEYLDDIGFTVRQGDFRCLNRSNAVSS